MKIIINIFCRPCVNKNNDFSMCAFPTNKGDETVFLRSTVKMTQSQEKVALYKIYLHY